MKKKFKTGKVKEVLFSNSIKIFCLKLFLILGILGLVYSTYGFFIGFHNFDLSYNACVLANDNNLDYRAWGDEYEIGKSISLTDLYIIGAEQMTASIFLMGISGLATGYNLCRLLSLKKEEE